MINLFRGYTILNLIIAASLIILLSASSAEAEKPTDSDEPFIKKITSFEIKQEDKFIPISKPGWHMVVFEACAGSNEIINPEAIIISDSDSKKIKLSNNLDPKNCQMSSVKIMASDIESITGSVIESGGISFFIKELEAKIAIAKDNLQTERNNLKTLVEEKQKQKTYDYKIKISELTDKIVKLKKELGDSRDVYNRVLYLAYK